MSERNIQGARRKAVKGGSQMSLRAAIEHGVKGDDVTPGKFWKCLKGSKNCPINMNKNIRRIYLDIL